MKTRHPRLVAGSLALLLLATVQSYAGGPLVLRAPGAPYLWPNGGQMIPFNPDQGGLGPLTNAVAVLQTIASFQAWADIPSASATHVNAGLLPEDVDETNFLPYFFPVAPDGLSAIVYDEDGAIFDLLFGPGSGVLGFAGPEWVNTVTGRIVEGVAFMNGGALLGPDAFPLAEMLAVQVHEFGHYQNLAHTVINGQIVAGPDSRGPSPFDTFPPPLTFANRIETMYPFLFINGGQATPHVDDVAMLSTLYPEPGFASSTGTISGHIVAPNNTTPVTGVNVIARNILNPYDDAVSAISSDFTDNFTPGAPLVGVYTLRGLTPGASYAIYVDRIMLGGFSTPPRNPLPGPEEFHNGPGESNDMATDLPNSFTPVQAVAGVTVSDIDVIFNRVPPGPIPAGDDTTFELFPAFTFDFCGQRYESVFVNSNGNLTFGAGNTDFTETIAEMLTGPPRIAALWDDLNAGAAPGSISYSETPDSITVSFTNIPEFNSTSVNTFAITLYRRANGDSGLGPAGRYSITYGALAAADGAAGYSCGGRLTSGFETETNLSATNPGRLGGLNDAAVFEVFTAGDNDLDNRVFEFESPGHFVEDLEAFNSPVVDEEDGPVVALPFNTVDNFTTVGPGDVDFYRVQARAGDILAIETVPGLTALDTVVGFFDANGNLLVADDDGGAGLLSRLLLRVAVDGMYSVGVSTFPDFGFTGGGEDAGRYVLSITKYRGTVLDFGDDPLADASVEIGLTTFAFPFQGTAWSSVFVNDNGNLTFGAASSDFSESVPELLAGPPRIAALWDDLNVLGGVVIAEEANRELRLHFVSVPEFLATGTNYFSVTLNRYGDITIDYGATNRSDAIVGVSPGGGAANPGPTDLSEASSLSAGGTTYQQFAPASFATYGGVDLSFSGLVFKKSR